MKPKGYWNDYEHCKEEVAKYSNRREFSTNCYGAYHSIKKHGWNELFEEMDRKNITRYHSYDEPIHCVYGYFFNETKTCYIGRTLRLKIRHRQHENGVLHSSGERGYDVVYNYCQTNHIKMPSPIVLVDKLTANESLEQEDYWLQYYKILNWVTLNIAPTGIGSGSLGTVVKWDYEHCKEEAKKYNSKTSFEIGNQSAYKSSVRNGWIDDFFISKKKPNGYWHDIENCKHIALECKNIKELSVKYASAYNVIRKNKWQGLLVFKK